MFDALPVLARLFLAFLVGSIPFAVLAMRGTGVNILRAGSGNPGFNNVLRYSRSRAIVTLAGDLGKGMLAVAMFHSPGDPLTTGWLYGFAAVLGHCYSPFLAFNGGKGIATSGGVMIVLYPAYAALCLAIFTVLRVSGAKRRWLEAGTIASLSSWFLFAAIVASLRPPQEAWLAALMAGLVTFRHKKNFAVLFSAWRSQRERIATAEER
jgi:glycerol-3-phosphate acyltransferase PlsY